MIATHIVLQEEKAKKAPVTEECDSGECGESGQSYTATCHDEVE